MQIAAILRDAEGIEQNRVASDDMDTLRVMVDAFLLPAAGRATASRYVALKLRQ